MSHEIIFFGGFGLFIAIMLALDLGLFNKEEKAVSIRQASLMSLMWIAFAFCFYMLLYLKGDFLHNIDSLERLQEITKKYDHPLNIMPNHLATSIELYNHNLALEFFTGYLVEYALSVDNIFVILLIFNAFGVKSVYYHRVLFWGILGAVVMRFLFIFLGAALITRFEWILYVFGAFLLYSGLKILFKRDEDETIDTEDHFVVRFLSKYFTITPEYRGNSFFVKDAGKKMVTPLFVVLIIIEFTDLIFAVDSIPAIFVVTKDPFVVFFSNIFAILGLRSMFFLLVNVVTKFHLLKVGLAVLLSFIGVKMLAHHLLEEIGFTNTHSLLVISAILGSSILLSILFPKEKSNEELKNS